VAFIEVARRKPSLKLMARIGKTLGPDPRELLVLAHPEARVLLSPTESDDPRERLPPSWQRFIENSALLARYQVTKRERQILEHLSLLGTAISAKHFLVILTLIRDIPEREIASPRKLRLASQPTSLLSECGIRFHVISGTTKASECALAKLPRRSPRARRKRANART
jgi:hypothetical protein